jgi:hypothetical protein
MDEGLLPGDVASEKGFINLRSLVLVEMLIPLRAPGISVGTLAQW